MAGPISEVRAKFGANADGFRNTIRGMREEVGDFVKESTGGFDNFSKRSKRSFDDTDKHFGKMHKNIYKKLDTLPEHLKPFHESLNETRKGFVQLDKQAGKSMDEMSTAALKTRTSLDKMTSVTDTGKAATKIIQGMSDSVKETRLAVLGLNKDGTVKISSEESKKQLEKFREEIENTKKSLEKIRDAGDFASYDAGMEVLNRKLQEVDKSFQAAAYGGTRYTQELRKMGIVTSDMANQMAIRMEGFKDSFINSVDLMNARASTSSKMMKILPEVSHIPKLDKMFLNVGDKLETMAKKGSAANLALEMLGKNASMKDIMDRITLINLGLMRMNSVALAGGIAFAGYTAGMIKLSEAVDGRLGPAFEEFKKTWMDALTPFAHVWTDVALVVVEAGKQVGEFVKTINELNPSISAAVGMFSFLFTGLTVILSPMAIGIGRAKGMQAAFNSVMMIAKPLVTGLLRIAGAASVIAGGMVILGGIFMKMWNHSENLRMAIGGFWATLKDAGAEIGGAFKQAFSGLIKDFKSLLNLVVGSDGKNMQDFWQTLGDKVASGINTASAAIMTITAKITDFIKKMGEWEGFTPVVTGLVAAFVTYKTIMIATTTAQKAWNVVTKVSIALSKAYRAAQIAMALSGGGLRGVLLATRAAMAALNITMLANPFVLIVALLVGLGVAFVVAYKKSETFRDIVNGAWKSIKKGWSATVEFFTKDIPKWAKNVAKWFGDAKDGAVKKWDELKNSTKKKFNEIKDWFVKWGPLMIAALLGPIGLAAYGIYKNWDEIKKYTEKIFKAVLKFLSDTWTKIKDTTIGIAKKLYDGIKEKYNNIKKNTEDVFNAIGKFYKKVWDGYWNIVKGVLKTIKDGIYNGWKYVSDKTTSFFGTIKKTLYDAWASIKDTAGKAVDWVKKRVSDAWQSIKNTAYDKFKSIRTTLSDAWSAMKKTAGDSVDWIKKRMSDAWSSAKNSVYDMFDKMYGKVKKTFDNMVDGAKKLPGRIGTGISNLAKNASNGAISMGNSLLRSLGKGVNGTISGINWVLRKVNAKELNKWDVPQYKNGTPNHPGGPAIVGDGGLPELIATPDGRVLLSPNKSTMIDLPAGSSVLDGEQTRMAMANGVPAYKNGIGDFFEMLGGGAKSLVKKVWDKYIPKLPKVGGAMKEVPSKAVGMVKDKAFGFLKKKLDGFMDFGGGSSVNITGGASAWKGQILKAAAMMKEKVTGAQLNGIIAQIQRESGGNQKITQSSAVVDVNTLAGNPARGLLQYIPQTFRAYSMRGFNNIYDGFHQLLAWFNNKNWRRDLPYGRRGWGPSGGRKYNGFFEGARVAQKQLAWIAEKGAEYVIPTDGSQRAMNLWQQAGQELGMFESNTSTNSNNTIHHILDLVNVPAHIDQDTLEKMLVQSFKSPRVQTELDKTNETIYGRTTRPKGGR